MYEINKKSAAVMEKLIAELDDGYLKLDNAPGTFMPVVVEQVSDVADFEAVYSVGHYGEQNGDLMADPEMTFGLKEWRFYPLSFRNNYVGVEQKVMGKEVNLPLQRRLARFADLWFSNIIKQQGITL
ncbi:MAG: hypothetical protein A2Y07_03915 [Planctomycetes bacterium GWF2_50_10]|nr:MAG: hypothetical protein A2Y07_03915 [Planctomycetes bacterium GWF2_50_10]